MSRDLTDCGAPRPILSHQRSPKPVHLTTPSPFLSLTMLIIQKKIPPGLLKALLDAMYVPN